MSMTTLDYQALRYAKTCLETSSLAAKISTLIGRPIAKGFDLLPATWTAEINDVTQTALQYALKAALTTIQDKRQPLSSDIGHKMVAALSGASGGWFGFSALAVELPVSTTIMLRSIADIARGQGESIEQPEVKLACLQVFALGTHATADHAAETAYFAVRTALARDLAAAAEHLAEKGLAQEGTPALIRFLNLITSRFGVTVSEKVAAQAVPIIGAVGGAVINTLFINHFQDMARGHFIIRRLERLYDPEHVRQAYEHVDAWP